MNKGHKNRGENNRSVILVKPFKSELFALLPFAYDPDGHSYNEYLYGPWVNVHWPISDPCPVQNSLDPSTHGPNVRLTQPSILSGTENKYRPKYGDTVRLGSKGRYSWFHLWINVWVACKTVWSSLTRAVPERFRDEFLMIKLYKSSFTLLIYYSISTAVPGAQTAR